MGEYLSEQVHHLESQLRRVTAELREDPHQPPDFEAKLAQAEKEQAEVASKYDAELAQLRQRVASAVEVNAELRARCRELEQEASRARVVAATAALTSAPCESHILH